MVGLLVAPWQLDVIMAVFKIIILNNAHPRANRREKFEGKTAPSAIFHGFSLTFEGSTSNSRTFQRFFEVKMTTNMKE